MPRILLAEADLELAHTLTLALRTLGYEPAAAGSVGALDAQLNRTMPDLAVVGNLGQEDEWSVCQRLRDRFPDGELPVVLLSSAAREAPEHRDLAEGSVHLVLRKPVDLGDFIEGIGRVMGAGPDLLRAAAESMESGEISIPLLRAEYLSNAGSRLGPVRDALSALRFGDDRPAALRCLLSAVTEIRGSAATFGLPAISRAAVELEEYVSLLEGSLGDWAADALGRLDQRLHALEDTFEMESPADRRDRRRTEPSRRRCLLVSGDAELCARAAQQAEEHGVMLRTHPRLASATEACLEQRAELVILDLRAGDELALAACIEMRRRLLGVPLMALVGAAVHQRIRAMRSGIDVLLTQPLSLGQVSAEARRLASARSGMGQRILVFSEDARAIEEVRAAMLSQRVRVLPCHDPGRLWAAVAQTEPDVVVMETSMKGCDAFELCRSLRLDPRRRALPVIFLAERDGHEERLKCFRAGGDDLVGRPAVLEELRARIVQRLGQSARVSRLMERDPFSGLLNRRAFLDGLGLRVEATLRGGARFCLALMRLDRAPEIATFGAGGTPHRMTEALASVMGASFRSDDITGQLSGQEFGVVLSNITMTDAVGAMRRVRERFTRGSMAEADGHRAGSDLRIGVARCPDHGRSAAQLMNVVEHAVHSLAAGGVADGSLFAGISEPLDLQLGLGAMGRRP
jgi:diguanylate cyclase (GGDEF)-like protein